MEPRITIKHESASAVLKQRDGNEETYEVTRVYANKRQQGHGTGLMETLTKFADTNGLFLTLVVRPYRAVADKIMDKNQLVRFYKKFGFVEIGTYYEPQMMRLPTLATCDSCGARITAADTVHNVGDSFEVVLYCGNCVSETKKEIEEAKEQEVSDNNSQVMVVRINNLAGKMIGYLDVDPSNIPSQEMLPVFRNEMTELVKKRLGQDVTVEFIDRELERFGLRQTPEGNLESV